MTTSTIRPTRLLVPLGLGLALSLLGDATLYSVLPDPRIAAQAGVGLGTVGILLGVNRLVRIFFNGPVGAFYDRMPRRPLMVLSIGIGVLSTLCYALGRGFPMLLIGRVLWGMAWSGLWIGGNTMVLDIAGEEERGSLSGRLQMWFFVAVGVSSFAGGLFTDLFSFHRGLLISSGLSVCGLLLWLFALPETRPLPSGVDKQEMVKAQGPLNIGPALLAAVPLFSMRVVFAGVLASTGILWLGAFVGDGIELGRLLLPLATLSGLFSGGRVLFSVVSAPLAGKLSDRMRNRWGVLAVALISGAGGLWLMTLESPIMAFGGAVLAALSGGSVPALVPALIGDQYKINEQSKALGTVYTVGDFGSAIGPPAALALIPVVGLPLVYIGCAVIYLLAGIFSLLQSQRVEKAGETLPLP